MCDWFLSRKQKERIYLLPYNRRKKNYSLFESKSFASARKKYNSILLEYLVKKQLSLLIPVVHRNKNTMT